MSTPTGKYGQDTTARRHFFLFIPDRTNESSSSRIAYHIASSRVDVLVVLSLSRLKYLRADEF